MVRIPACHAGGRGFESRPLRHLFESRLFKHESQGCSSNWQSSGFQIRVLGVRISPPLPYSKGSSRKTGAFLLFDVELFNWQSSGFPRLTKNSACWEFESLHPCHIQGSSRNARAFSFVARKEQRIPPLPKTRVLEVRVFLHLPSSKL